MEIEQIDEPDRTCAVHRRTITMDEIRDFYDHAYSRVVAAVTGADPVLTGPAIGWYHGVPTHRFAVSAGFPVAGDPGSLGDDVEVVTLPGGPALTAVHQGGYDALGESWQELTAELGRRRLDGRGDCWEEYLTDPLTAADPSDLRTRLVLPLA